MEHLLDMEKHDYAIAGKMVNDLLEDIGANDPNNDIQDILEMALKADPTGVEINSEPYHGGYVDPESIDFIRIESYGGHREEYNGAAIMYVYLYPAREGGIDKSKIWFDFYPNSDNDDYADSVGYKDCMKYMNESSKRVYKEDASNENS